MVIKFNGCTVSNWIFSPNRDARMFGRMWTLIFNWTTIMLSYFSVTMTANSFNT